MYIKPGVASISLSIIFSILKIYHGRYCKYFLFVTCFLNAQCATINHIHIHHVYTQEFTT